MTYGLMSLSKILISLKYPSPSFFFLIFSFGEKIPHRLLLTARKKLNDVKAEGKYEIKMTSKKYIKCFVSF